MIRDAQGAPTSEPGTSAACTWCGRECPDGREWVRQPDGSQAARCFGCRGAHAGARLNPRVVDAAGARAQRKLDREARS